MSEALERIADARSALKAREAEVDAEIEVLRAKRLAENVTMVENAVARAYGEGETIAAIKRAYGTKDYGTIRAIIDANPVTVQEAQLAMAEITSGGRYQVEEGGILNVLGEDGEVAAVYAVIELADDGGFLLDAMEGNDDWDGDILDGYDSDPERNLAYETLKEAPND